MGETNFDKVINLKQRLLAQDDRENNDLASFSISNSILRGDADLTAEEKGLFVLLSRYATPITDTKKMATYQVTITFKQVYLFRDGFTCFFCAVKPNKSAKNITYSCVQLLYKF